MVHLMRPILQQAQVPVTDLLRCVTGFLISPPDTQEDFFALLNLAAGEGASAVRELARIYAQTAFAPRP